MWADDDDDDDDNADADRVSADPRREEGPNVLIGFSVENEGMTGDSLRWWMIIDSES